MSRKEGYYWVKDYEDWVIALWEMNSKFQLPMWHYTYGGEIIVTDIVQEINENRIPSPEESQNVFAGQWATDKGNENIYISLPHGVTLERFIDAIKNSGTRI